MPEKVGSRGARKVNYPEIIASLDLLWNGTNAGIKHSYSGRMIVYNQIQASQVYKAIDERIHAGLDVDPQEYLYYALVATDVRVLDPDLLEAYIEDLEKRDSSDDNPVNITPKIKPFIPNLTILHYGLRAQNNKSFECGDKFAKALFHRSESRLGKVSLLNLSGLVISDVLTICDGLYLSHCLLYKVRFAGSFPKIISRSSIYHDVIFTENWQNSYGYFENCDFTDMIIRAPSMISLRFITSRFHNVLLQVDHIEYIQIKNCEMKESKIMIAKSTCHVGLSMGCFIKSDLDFGDIEGMIFCEGVTFSDARVTARMKDGFRYPGSVAVRCCSFNNVDFKTSIFADSIVDITANDNQIDPFSDVYDQSVFSSSTAMNELLDTWAKDLVSCLESHPRDRHQIISDVLLGLANILCSHIAAYYPPEGLHQPYYIELLQHALDHRLFSFDASSSRLASGASLFAVVKASTPARVVLSSALNVANEKMLVSAALCALTSF